MPASAPSTTDPLSAFTAGAFTSEPKRPVPLVSTSFDVMIEAGLAVVTTQRIFRNDEPNSIEATITFPVPVHATLFALEARVDGRVLTARAQRRTKARETYEEAIARGQGAVLHEEVLRGVHMLSVGHIPAGGEVGVSTTWATTLTIVDGRGGLRIPLTVGDIYGRSGLPDSDDLIQGGPIQTADLTVRCSNGSVALLGGGLEQGRARVVLNAPIDLTVTGWQPRDLGGRAADGREVLLRVEPSPVGDAPLSVAVLVDHSGSMAETCSGDGRSPTKHEAVVAGLKALADGLVDRDIVELWEFDNALTSIGSTPTKSRRSLPSAVLGRGPRQRLQALVARLSGPAGGTEIGAALAGLLAQSTTRDVLLITDGKSHALDVQTLAQSGRRISVVLIGEDSLEANVGHLAALSGGDIFVVAGSDLREVLAAVVGALRRPCEPLALITGELRQIKTCRGNAALLAKWRPGDGPISRDVLGHAVAALAAGLALPALGPDAAAELAEAEGLVTHLTSLVLVDEAAQIQQGVPAARKIALPSPRTSLKLCAPRLSAAISPALGAVYSLGSAQPAPPLRRPAMPDIPPSALIDLSWMGSRIDWDAGPNQLLAGDLSGLDRDIVRLIERAAALAEVVALAAHLKIQAVTLIIGLVARAHFAANRSAGRIAKAVLGARTSPDLEALGLRLGLKIISSY